MKYAIDIGSLAMIHIPSFIMIGLGIQKLIEGDSQPTLIFSKQERLANNNNNNDNDNSILHFLCAESTAVRPITDTAQCTRK
jgi:hypothetical protein